MVILHRTSWEAWWREGRGSEFADNLAEYQIRSPLPSIKAGGGWGKPLALSLSWFPAKSVFIQTRSQRTMIPPNSFLWQLHCCWCSVVLLWLLNSNKRNLVEVQLEKSKLAVGHFDKLQRRAMATPAPSARPTFTRLCRPSLGNSQHPKS